MILRSYLSAWQPFVIYLIFRSVTFAQNATDTTTSSTSVFSFPATTSAVNPPKLLQSINLNGTGVLSGIPIPTMFPPVITPISDTLRIKTETTPRTPEPTSQPVATTLTTATLLSDILADNATLISLLAAAINTANKQLTVPNQAAAVPALPAPAAAVAPALGSGQSTLNQQSGYNTGQSQALPAAAGQPFPGQVSQPSAPANQNFAVLPSGGAYGGSVQPQQTFTNNFNNQGFSGQQGNANPGGNFQSPGVQQQSNTFQGGNTNFNTGGGFPSNQNQITGIGGNQQQNAQPNPTQNQFNTVGPNQQQQNTGITNQQQQFGLSNQQQQQQNPAITNQQQQNPGITNQQQQNFGLNNQQQQNFVSGNQQQQNSGVSNQQQYLGPSRPGGYGGGGTVGIQQAPIQQQIQQPVQQPQQQTSQGGYGGGGASIGNQPALQNSQGGYGGGGGSGNNFPPTYATPIPTGFTAAPTFPQQPLTGFTAAPTQPVLQTPLPINSNTYNQLTSGFPLPVGYYAGPQQSAPGGLLPPPATGYGGGNSMQQVSNAQPALNNNQNINQNVNNQQATGAQQPSGSIQNAGFGGLTAQVNTAFIGGGGGISAGGGFQGLQTLAPNTGTGVTSVQTQNQRPLGSTAGQSQQQQIGQTGNQGSYGSSSYSGGIPNTQVQFNSQAGISNVNNVQPAVNQGGQAGYGGQQPAQPATGVIQGFPNQNQPINQPPNQQNNINPGFNTGNTNTVLQQAGYGSQGGGFPAGGTNLPQNTNFGSAGQQGISQLLPSGVIQNQPTGQAPQFPTQNQVFNQQQQSVSIPNLQGGYGQTSGGQPVAGQNVQPPGSVPPVIISSGSQANIPGVTNTPVPPNLGQPTPSITAPNVLVQNPGTTTPFSGFGGLGSLAQSIQEQLGVTRPTTTTSQPTSSNPFPVITPTVQPGLPVSNTIATGVQGVNTQIGASSVGQPGSSGQQLQQPSAQFPPGSQFGGGGAQQPVGGQTFQQNNQGFGNVQQTGGQFGVGGVSQQAGVNQVQNAGNNLGSAGGYNAGSLGGGIPVNTGQAGGGFGQQAGGGVQNTNTNFNTGQTTGQQNNGQQNNNQPAYATLNRGSSYR